MGLTSEGVKFLSENVVPDANEIGHGDLGKHGNTVVSAHFKVTHSPLEK